MNANNLKKIINNPNIIYLINKYVIFIISFINSLLIAVKLEAYYLGVWGFINLIISYFTYASFGTPYSLNVIISKNKSDIVYAEKIYHNSFGLLGIIIFFLLVIYLVLGYFQIEIGSKYNFSSYSLVVVPIIILNLINGNLSIILRIYNKVNLISLTQSFYPVLTFVALFLIEKELLLKALVYILLFSSFLTCILYLLFSPFRFRMKFDWRTMKTIQTKGMYLFVYAASFYFIMLSTKSFISDNYTVKEFGYFTFSFSFANSVLLLMSTLSFLIFPKMISLLSSKDDKVVSNTISSLRTNYIVFSHLLIHFSIFIFPFFLYFFPQYKGALISYQLIGLTLIMYNNAFGYQTLLMARDKEKLLSILSFSALVLNILLAFILTTIIHIPFSCVILCTLITYFLYVIALTFFGRKSLKMSVSVFSVFNDANNYKIMIPYLVSIICVFLGVSSILFLIPLSFFLILNKNELKEIILSIKKLIKNPNYLNI